MPTIPAPTARGARPNGATVATGATGTTGGGGARREGRSAPAVEGSAETGDAQVTPSACVIVTMELAPRVVRHDGPSARVALPFFTSNRSPAERPSPAPICAKPAPRGQENFAAHSTEARGSSSKANVDPLRLATSSRRAFLSHGRQRKRQDTEEYGTIGPDHRNPLSLRPSRAQAMPYSKRAWQQAAPKWGRKLRPRGNRATL